MIYLIEAMLHQSKSGSRAMKLKHPNSKQKSLCILNNAIHILFNEVTNLMRQELFIFRWLLRLNNGNTLCIISTQWGDCWHIEGTRKESDAIVNNLKAIRDPLSWIKLKVCHGWQWIVMERRRYRFYWRKDCSPRVGDWEVVSAGPPLSTRTHLLSGVFLVTHT
jgi:hypothetical protein